ncbi:GTPase-activating protein [Wickerhamomyces ciferrii]|uniref:GTPase-activating protein n=1 Tax=Wickerhamomyces ciferrii (strain ATCC 14091 / BCRC 22168 / CBS 111 / JCM 3599 / NBRC 0793 / NRRL Y-1031 F-60-10) TaxID=1206466 RepID=K0KF27_WICCF|nr:GTPase-activating protein [Wickerhamomyces ciferrii]CCH40812.1 GTPase-activating protein [Wickerhamomyces ciferrii]
MSFFNTIRERASSLSIFDKANVPKKPSKDELFREEFKLPDDETIIDETAAEMLVVSKEDSNQNNASNNFSSNENQLSNHSNFVFSGKLYLTKHYIVFRDSFDRKSCVIVLNLSTVKKVERIPSRAYVFALSIVTNCDIKLLIQFIGIRSRSEEFSYKLKTCLRDNVSNTKKIDPFLESLYSEFIVKKNEPGADKSAIHSPDGGLGQLFKYPGDPKKLRDKSKLRLWYDYFRRYGRNLSIARQKMFYKLLRVGLPNRLRGEIWELTSGAMYLRYQNLGIYEKLLKDNEGTSSIAIDEIEKDLNRSLPEYSAYQSEEGIGRLRRVLTAYSWKNPDVGYCQAMNIVAAALLIFQTEEQAFWTLSVLIEKFVPGYYSKTMYGTLLDQKVFESLVEKTMPILWTHITKYDIQLSVVSLPWFLSLFLNSMPLVFAFRIIDVFFLHGPKALFQVALAILRINGEELLEIDDDGTFISVLKDYFSQLDDSAHPNSKDPKFRQLTKFQELLIVAFKEFSNITDEMINQERNKHKPSILQNIETFIKRSQLRNLPRTPNLSKEHISNIYDRFYNCIQSHKASLGVGSSSMEFKTYQQFMNGFCDWALPEEEYDSHPEDFLHRLFRNWDKDSKGVLSLTDVVVGLDKLVNKNLMESISYFFEIYDYNNKGEVDREGILQISEGLLYITKPLQDGKVFDFLTKKSIENYIADKIVEKQNETNDEVILLPSEVNIDQEIFQREQGERYLSAASDFIQRAFEYAQPAEVPELIEIDDKKDLEKIKANAALDPNHPLTLNLATFRMVILADESYELLFSETLSSSIHLDRSTNISDKGGILRDMFDGLLADGRRVANQVRRRMDSSATSSSNNHDSSSIKSKPGNASLIEEEDEDDFGADATSNDYGDLLENAEIQALGDVPVSNNVKKDDRENELKVLHGEMTEIEKGLQNQSISKDKNLIEFEN